MLTKEPSRISQREDSHQSAVLGNERAPDVLRRQVTKDTIERLANVDDIGVGNEDIADEQLLFRGQSEAGVERSLEVSVCQHADQRVALLHGEMANLVLDHEGPGHQHTV